MVSLLSNHINNMVNRKMTPGPNLANLKNANVPPAKVSPAMQRVYAAQRRNELKQNGNNLIRDAIITGGTGPIVNHLKEQVKARAPGAVQAVLALNDALPPQYKINKENITNAFKGKGNMIPPVNGDGSPMNSSYGLSKAPNPKMVNLNSGIVPNAYANDYMVAEELKCSPMHMSSGTLQIPTDAANSLNPYFLNTIAFDIQTRAQANIDFNLDLTTSFSSASILTAMNSGIKALQVYFYYSSIMAYESDPRNKNSAMINLRSGITSQMISDLAQLGRRLEDTPVPPRIVEWVRYMSMNYLSGNSQGSPLLKIAPNNDFSTSGGTTITAALALLTTSNPTYVLIRRSIPQWRVGTLYDVPVTPVFDKNFLTIFANLPAIYGNSVATQVFSPNVATSTDLFMYNSYNNRLDGAAYAMCSAHAGGIQYPGLFKSDGTTASGSRKSYYAVSGTTTWYTAPPRQFLSVSRPETYMLASPADTTPLKLHLPGAEMCQGVSIASLTQTGQNFLDFVFNINTIPTNGRLNSFNRRGNGKI